MVLRIDVKASRELQAVLLAVKRAPAEIQKQVRDQMRALGQPAWSQALAEHASTRLEHRVLVDTARLTPSNQNIRLSSASVGRPLAGGLDPKTQYGGVEFGANRNQVVSYARRSPKGGSHTVKRHTQNQLRWRNRKGYVFYPAVAEMVPRMAALLVQTVVRTFAEKLEGK